MASRPFTFEEPAQQLIVVAAGVEHGEALGQLRSLYRRFRMRYALVGLAVVVIVGAGFATMLTIGGVSRGQFVPGPDPLMNIAILIMTGALAAAVVWRGLVVHHRREVERCLYMPACFRCGYVLHGLPIERIGSATHILCPECNMLSPAAPPGAPGPPPDVVGRLTDRGRRVLKLANGEAQRFNHEYIGTEHILLGLVKEGQGIGATVLRNHQIGSAAVNREVEQLVRAGPAMISLGRLPMTPRARRVLQFAAEEARTLGHNYIGTEHILLGLIREHDGVAAQALRNLGLDLHRLRASVRELLGGSTPDLPESPGPALPGAPAASAEGREFAALIDSWRTSLQKQKHLAEGAIAQVTDAQLHISLAPGLNSIAIIMQHMSGNMRSRFAPGWLSADGERPERNREGEFVDRGLGRDELLRLWNDGWSALMGAVDALEPCDLSRTIHIRGEPHTLALAMMRQLAHCAYHTGQIMLIARGLAGEDEWKWLTIPRGGA